MMGSSSCLPAREGAVVMLHSLLRFLSSHTDECTGNGGPGLMECTATAGRLGLGLLGLEGDTLGSSALLARDRDDQLFLGLGQRRVRAETARKMLDRLGFGDGRDFVVDGRRLLLVTSAAGKSLPNAKELTCGCLDAPVHNFRAYILSEIARRASSSSTKERASASRALTAVLSL